MASMAEWAGRHPCECRFVCERQGVALLLRQERLNTGLGRLNPRHAIGSADQHAVRARLGGIDDAGVQDRPQHRQ